jgi:hypothetical protein
VPDLNIKEEHIDLTEYLDFTDAYAQIGCSLDQVYQHKCLHSALGFLKPAGFEHQWRLGYPKPEL